LAEGFKKFYRVFRWVVLAAMLLVLVLMMWTTAPPRVQKNPGAAENAREKVGRFQSAVEQGIPHTLRLDEAELNSFLGENLALAPAASEAGTSPAEPTIEQVQSTVRDVKITLRRDLVGAYVVFDFYGKEMSLEIEGKLRAENGYLRMDVTSGSLGALPLPQTTLDNAVRRLFDSPENKEKFRLPDGVSDVRVENGQVIVDYGRGS